MKAIQQTEINEITRLHNEIEESLRMSLQKAIRIGELLSKAKDELKHGEFLSWVRNNLPFAERTAQRYMNLFNRQDELAEVNNITEAYRMIEPAKNDTVSYLDNKQLFRISDIICRKECYARFSINWDMVKRYSENIGFMPPVEINQDNILIDGWHRLEACKLIRQEYIPYFITNTNSDSEIKKLSVLRNSKHGLALTIKDELRLWETYNVQTKHEMGKRILKDIDKFGKPEYGNKRIENLAKDTKNSIGEIKACIEFAKQYPDFSIWK